MSLYDFMKALDEILIFLVGGLMIVAWGVGLYKQGRLLKAVALMSAIMGFVIAVSFILQTITQ